MKHLKKDNVLGILILMFVVASISVFAEDVTTLSNISEPNDIIREQEIYNPLELEAFSVGNGPEYRMAQLENAIDRNIKAGSIVIEKITTVNSSIDVTELEAILSELTILKTQVQETDILAVENPVETFVELKSDALELSKQFRDAGRELVKDRAEQIRNEIRVKKDTWKEEEKSSLEQLKRGFIGEKFKGIGKKLGYNNSELFEQYKNGEINLTTMQEMLKEQFKAQSNETRKEKMMEHKQKQREYMVNLLANKTEHLLNIQQKEQERMDKRLEKMQNETFKEKRMENFQKYTEKRQKQIEKIQEKRQEQTDKREEQIKKIEEKRQEQEQKLQDMQQKRENRSEGRGKNNNNNDNEDTTTESSTNSNETASENKTGDAQ